MALDAIVVGAGPNGLAAAITLARAGWQVEVREAQQRVGGGACSDELTLPGFRHDLCSAVHPLGEISPFLRELPLREHGLEYLHSPSVLAHPLDAGQAILLERSVGETAGRLGVDAAAYARLLDRLVGDWPRLEPALTGPLVRLPRHPLPLARFGLVGVRSALSLVNSRFREEQARALVAGCAAHSMLALERPLTAAFGLSLLTLGHLAGWPIPAGGAQSVADALHSYLRSLGGEVVTGAPVRSLAELPPARAIVCDLTPRQLLAVAGERLPPSYARRLARFRYGPGAFKVDWALDGPIPWSAPECGRAATVHLGGTTAEIAASERAPHQGRSAERPFVLLSQPSLFDALRAPADKHTAWAYCHVPHGSAEDMLDRVERQVERFAPGFRDLVLARSVFTPAELERRNANLVGGDVNGGLWDLRQAFARPTLLHPYETPLSGLYLCSASTPPGGGVHGLCGYRAAQALLRRHGRREGPLGDAPRRPSLGGYQ